MTLPRSGARPPLTGRAPTRGTTIVALAILVACNVSHEPTPTVADLEASARAFFEGMASEDAATNRAAMQRLVPTRADFDTLFPTRSEKPWRVWSPEAAKLVDEAPQRSHEYRTVLPIRRITSIDFRREHATPLLERAIATLPAGTPVRGVVIEVTPGERLASTFIPVNGRWIWLWDLERLPPLLADDAAPPR